MTVATCLSVDVRRFQPETWRAGGAMRALTQALDGVEALTPTTDHGHADWLLLWGPGAPDRWPVMQQQLAAGGRLICLDLAYWHRDTKVRVSIDAAHPQQWVMKRDWPMSRFVSDAVPVADRWKPNGPIVVAGLGRKARTQYGDAVGTWEAAMIVACRDRWPNKPVWYRPKQADAPVPANVPIANGSIERVLAGASLLVTWHSNVAVDAIRMGIPVVCRNGAAAAVSPSELPFDPQPLPVSVRDRFLGNLAWFQWNPDAEAAQFWAFLQELLK